MNDSASPKIVIQIYVNFFQFFLKVLELFECRRGDSYMTANGNYIRFTQLLESDRSIRSITRKKMVEKFTQSKFEGFLYTFQNILQVLGYKLIWLLRDGENCIVGWVEIHFFWKSQNG